MANPPQMPQTFFADGNASLVRLGAALGAAVVFGAGAFAPAQPKPQVAQRSQGDRAALLIAFQGSAQVFSNTATAASQPKVRERGLIFAQPQFDPSYYAAVIFTRGAGLYPAQPAPASPQVEFWQRPLDQPAAVVFKQQPGTISVAPYWPSVFAQAIGQDPTQIAPQVFGTLAE